ncbi:Neuropeptide Y receptor type 2 [Trichoplax sp. H2]|nr:Neuropeptide Y receptor type 2 [Trichoplax sp. H2]|eukprot:RDD37845.1 Neuropeptide Y receptor type 2 [Trichoplax sp. H2]
MNKSFNTNLSGNSNIAIIVSPLAMILIPMTILGLVLNLFLAVVLSLDKCFNNRIYRLIRISLISDIISNLTLTINYFFTLTMNTNYRLAKLLCQIIFYTTTSSYGVSIMTLCLIATDRYLVITKPTTRLHLSTQQHFILIGQIFVWIISLTTAVPIINLIDVYQNGANFCDFPIITPAVSIFLYLLTTTLYILPTIIIVFMYRKIILFTRKYIRPINFNHEQEHDHIARRKFVKMLITVTSCYVLMSWPFFATLLGIATTRVPMQRLWSVNQIYFLLAYFSFSVTIAITIINPILYLKFDLRIRKASILLLKGFVPHSRQSHPMMVIPRGK